MTSYRHWLGFVLAEDSQGPVTGRVVCSRCGNRTIATVRRQRDTGALVLLTLSRRNIAAGFIRKHTRFDVWDLWPLAVAEPCETRCPKHGWLDIDQAALDILKEATTPRKVSVVLR